MCKTLVTVVCFQIVNPKMMESLRQQVLTELEKPFRDKVSEVETELDRWKSDYRKLKYDYTFLKSEYEHETSEHKGIINELTLRYEAEVRKMLSGIFYHKMCYMVCKQKV